MGLPGLRLGLGDGFLVRERWGFFVLFDGTGFFVRGPWGDCTGFLVRREVGFLVRLSVGLRVLIFLVGLGLAGALVGICSNSLPGSSSSAITKLHVSSLVVGKVNLYCAKASYITRISQNLR